MNFHFFHVAPSLVILLSTASLKPRASPLPVVAGKPAADVCCREPQHAPAQRWMSKDRLEKENKYSWARRSCVPEQKVMEKGEIPAWRPKEDTEGD